MDPEGESGNIEKKTTFAAFGFAASALKYGLKRFFRVGAFWWLLVAAYAAVQAGSASIIDDQAELTLGMLVTGYAFTFVDILILLPLMILGLEYFHKGRAGPGEMKGFVPLFFPFLGAWLISFCMWMLVPGFLPMLLFVTFPEKAGMVFLAVCLMAVGGVWSIYWLYRMFPYLYIVLDKKRGPVDSFRYSLRITKKKFLPVFTYFVLSAILYIAADLLPLKAGHLLIWPILVLASIHAYKQLDAHYTGQRQHGGAPGPAA